jgi:cystathionine gamma-synthase
MADVRGYEEREPRVINALRSGYPRFVVHVYIAELIEWYLKRESQQGRAAVLIPGRRATQDLVDWIGAGVISLKVEDALYLVYFDGTNRDLNHRVQKFVQHTGCGISSRQAEDLLCAHGLQDTVHPETSFAGNAQAAVETQLAGLIGCDTKDVLVCSCGMNAFYAGFRAVQEAQSVRGRTKWLQLGWLYLDSGCVLKEFLDENASLDYCYDATDTDVLVKKIKAYGESLACVVIECPTNPLVQVADLARIAEAVRGCGGILMIDPTIASIYNVDVLPYADLLVTSLTKYACYQGDVMIGALALNPQSSHYGDLVLRTSGFYQPPYLRDLARLAFELQSAVKAVEEMDANARQLADYLRAHSAVKKVHYAGYSDHFSEVAKSAGSGGAMITIELHGEIEPFYDRLQLMKGPSFGTVFTLACPFMYLAHYDLVTSEEGRRFLASIGIDPDLIRISVGTEPIEEIISVFRNALAS